MVNRLYGVSYGNGNNGVSHIFADFYVRTDRPYALATLAAVSYFPESGRTYAAENVEIDGEADYTITAMILDPPADDSDLPAYGEDDGEWTVDGLDDRFESESDAESAARDLLVSWSNANGAWFLCEVFPEDDPRDGRPMFDSLAEAFEHDSHWDAVMADEAESDRRDAEAAANHVLWIVAWNYYGMLGHSGEELARMVRADMLRHA